jgi:Fur family transcriptional regulator, ferric uptake regulator
MRGSDRFRGAQQLHHELRDVATLRVGLSTGYRILRALAEQKIAQTQRTEDGETLYRLFADVTHCIDVYGTCPRCR